MKSIKKTIFINAIFRILLLLVPYGNANATSTTDSLKNLFNQKLADSLKVDLYLNIADDYWRVFNTRNFEGAVSYTDSGLNLAIKSNYQLGLARAYFLKGKIAISYKRSFDNAAANLLQSLTIYEKLNNIDGQAACLMQLGVISLSLQNFQEAQMHFKRCISNENTNSHTLTVGNYLLAISYSETDSIEQAIAHFKIALEGYTNENDQIGIFQCNTYIGKMLINTHQYNSAVSMLRLAIKSAKGINDSTVYGRTYAFLATAFFNLNMVDSAVYYGELALGTGNDWLTRKEVYATLNKAYASNGSYDKAYYYLGVLLALNDSIYNSNIVKSIADLRGKFIYEKQLGIQKAQQEKESAERILGFEKQKLIRNAMLFIAVLLIILLLVVLNRYRLKQKHTEQLTIAFNDLKRTQEQLVQQEKLASLGSLTAGIAHEIKNPLNFINNFSELSSDLLTEFLNTNNEEDKKFLASALSKNLAKIMEHGKRADSIVKNMLEHSRSGKVEKQSTDINKLCEEFFNLTYHGMRGSNVKFNCTLKKDLAPKLPLVNVVAQDISRVLINLFNNAFYAVNEKKLEQSKSENGASTETYIPTVTLTTRLVNYQIEISIKDNGNGIPEKIKDKIFDPFFTTKPSGQGTGLGLSLSYDIIKFHNGNLKVKSQSGIFTEFIILIPTSL